MTFKAIVSRDGQLTLPKAVRDQLDLREGSEVLLNVNGDHLELRVRPRKTIDEIFDALPVTQAPPLEDDAIAKLYGEHRIARLERSR
jgi:AbrB family looped-hinge helix DNA binding protein